MDGRFWLDDCGSGFTGTQVSQGTRLPTYECLDSSYAGEETHMADGSPKKFGFRDDVMEVFLELIEPFHDITRDNMFGFPSFRASGEIFACIYQNGISLKMPEELMETILRATGITPFMPFGRAKMRQWIHIKRAAPEAFVQDFPLVEASVYYVRTLAAKAAPTADAGGARAGSASSRTGKTSGKKPPTAKAVEAMTQITPTGKGSNKVEGVKAIKGKPARAGSAGKAAPAKARTQKPAKKSAKSPSKKAPPKKSAGKPPKKSAKTPNKTSGTAKKVAKKATASQAKKSSRKKTR